MSKQSKLPRSWVWIDDGSTDATAQVLKETAAKYPQLQLWVESMPKKKTPNFFTLGKSHERVLLKLRSRIDALGADYLAVLDPDTEPCPNYFARLCSILDSDHGLGAVAGYPVQEPDKLKSGRPMNSGKMIRWSIVREIDKFWDYCPDSFYNLKAESRGYRVGVVKVPVSLDRPTTAVTSREGAFRQGRLYYYARRPVWAILLRSVWRQITRQHGDDLLRGYLVEMRRGTWKCDDPDVVRYYGAGKGPVVEVLAALHLLTSAVRSASFRSGSRNRQPTSLGRARSSASTVPKRRRTRS